MFCFYLKKFTETGSAVIHAIQTWFWRNTFPTASTALTLLVVSFGSEGIAQDFKGKFGFNPDSDEDFLKLEGIDVRASGAIYATDTGRNLVMRFDLDGNKIAQQSETSLPAFGLNRPGDVAAGSNGRVYVTDRFHNQVYMYDNDLNPIGHFGSACLAPDLPSDGCIDPDGDGPLEVGDGQFNSPNSIAWDPINERVLVTDDGNRRVQVFDEDGNFILKFGSQGNGNGQFSVPTGIAAGPNGVIAVGDSTANRIQVFSANGNFAFTFGSAGNGEGQFDAPVSVVIDPSGRIYVSERNGDRIQIFDPDGSHVSSAGSSCSLVLDDGCIDPDGDGPLDKGDGQFTRPRNLAVDSLGQIYVADEGNRRIQYFELDSDGDSYPDYWEMVGIDADGDGTIDLEPTALGTDFSGSTIALDPNRKDILVEVDYFDCNEPGGDCPAGSTHSHEPMDAALATGVQTFADAPVSNPVGPDGVNLWVQVDEALEHQQNCDLDDGCFDGIKSANFGTAAQRANDAVIAAKRLLFRYNLWVHDKEPGNSSSGEADGSAGVTGDDFVVSLGSWSGNVGSLDDQTGLFIHELGHTLGLGHGGGDNKNCKPNYLSVMSYTFTTTGLQPGGLFDYSRTIYPSTGFLKEDALDETIGIEDGQFTTFFGPPVDVDGDGSTDWLTGAGSGAIDWDNQGGNGDTPSLPTDINFLDINGCGSSGTPDASPSDTLTGYNDWDIIQFNFRDSELYTDGVHNSRDIEELDAETADLIKERIWKAQLTKIHEYSAKLLCGIQDKPDELRLAIGRYASVINIRNPNRKPVTFKKSLSLAYPPAEQAPGETFRISLDKLRYNEALKVDCEDLRNRLFDGKFPEGYIDGFLVVQSPESLDVVGVYTTATLGERDASPLHSSIEIDRVPERIVDLRGAAHPDLVIDRDVPVDSKCKGSDQTMICDVSIKFTARNIGQAAAGKFDVALDTPFDGKSVAVIAVEAGLAPMATFTQTVTVELVVIGTNPQARTLCIKADAPMDAVSEANEENNQRCVPF